MTLAEIENALCTHDYRVTIVPADDGCVNIEMHDIVLAGGAGVLRWNPDGTVCYTELCEDFDDIYKLLECLAEMRSEVLDMQRSGRY